MGSNRSGDTRPTVPIACDECPPLSLDNTTLCADPTRPLATLEPPARDPKPATCSHDRREIRAIWIFDSSKFTFCYIESQVIKGRSPSTIRAVLPSSTVENYLKAIYHGQSSLPQHDGLVPMGSVAAALGVTPGTATTM